MDNLNELRAIWRTASPEGLPNAEAIKQMAASFRNRKLQKKIRLIVSAGLMALLMIGVMFFYHSAMITTRIGELLMLSAACLLVYDNLNSIGRFRRYADYSNTEFLQFLEQTRVNQLRYHQKTQVAGLLLCSAGLLIYPFEFVHGKLVAEAMVYAFTIAFLLVLWLIIRPRTFQRQIRKTNEMIERLHSLSDQF